MSALLGFLRRLIVALLVGAGCAAWSVGSLRVSDLGVRGWSAAVAGVLLALLSQELIARGWQRVFEGPRDEYGPWPDDREAFDRRLSKIARINRNRAERLRVQRRMRDAMLRALDAPELKRAIRWQEKAESARAEWQERFHVPRVERRSLERRFAIDIAEAANARYENAALAQLERAKELKTPRGQNSARARARAIVEEARGDHAVDAARLERFARQHELFPDDPVAPPISTSAPSGVAPAQDPARWVPLGETVQLHGYDVLGGVYLGEALPAVAAEGEDPACLDPRLEVASRPTRKPRQLPESPSWRDLSPGARAGFLDWLAAGARDATASPAFPRLYLYGLERRLLADAETQPDARRGVGRLCTELERLSRAFASVPEVAVLARELADFCAVRYPAEQPDEPPSSASLVATEAGLSGRLRVGLARRIAEGTPLPFAWARAWLGSELAGNWRAAAKRCPDELEDLLALRYAERHGAGLVIAPGSGHLDAEYACISPSFAGDTRVAALDLPDPAGCAAARRALLTLADSCIAELAGLSRWRASAHEGDSPDLRVLSSLPAGLLARRDDPDLESLRALLTELDERPIDHPHRTVDLRRLLNLWPAEGRPSRADCAAFAQLLAALGYGVEPDVRFDGERWHEERQAILFPLPAAAPHAASRAYSGAVLVLRIAVAVSTADSQVGDAEDEALRAHLERTLDLTGPERVRLEAHLAWLLLEPPGLTRLRSRASQLPEDKREQMADLLIQIAAADGMVSPAEVRVLEKAYEVLELDPSRVHTDLHARDGQDGPAPRPTSDATAGGIGLDPDLIARKLRETAVVSALLDDIFDDEEPTNAAPATTPAATATYAGPRRAPLSVCWRPLAARDEWPFSEIEELAPLLRSNARRRPRTPSTTPLSRPLATRSGRATTRSR